MPLFKLGDKLLKVGDKLANGAGCCCGCECGQECGVDYGETDITADGNNGEPFGDGYIAWGNSTPGFGLPDYFYIEWHDDPSAPGNIVLKNLYISGTSYTHDGVCVVDLWLTATYGADHPAGSELSRTQKYRVAVVFSEDCCPTGIGTIGDPYETIVDTDGVGGTGPPASDLLSKATVEAEVSFVCDCTPLP